MSIRYKHFARFSKVCWVNSLRYSGIELDCFGPYSGRYPGVPIGHTQVGTRVSQEVILG